MIESILTVPFLENNLMLAFLQQIVVMEMNTRPRL